MKDATQSARQSSPAPPGATAIAKVEVKRAEPSDEMVPRLIEARVQVALRLDKRTCFERKVLFSATGIAVAAIPAFVVLAIQRLVALRFALAVIVMCVLFVPVSLLLYLVFQRSGSQALHTALHDLDSYRTAHSQGRTDHNPRHVKD